VHRHLDPLSIQVGCTPVVSGHIGDLTNTMPLHIEILYQECSFAAGFAVASLLSLRAVLPLVLKSLPEWRTGWRHR
jgi:sulfate transport system permease protein